MVVQGERRFGKWNFASISATSGLGRVNSSNTCMKLGRKCTPLYAHCWVFVLPFHCEAFPYRGLPCLRFPRTAGSHSGNALWGIFVMRTTNIIELPGRSGLVPRLEGSSRRQAAHEDQHIFFFST